jgi:DNA primase catalytic core
VTSSTLPPAEVDPQRLLTAHQLANEFYRSHVLDEPRALAYLRSRGIIAATAHAAPWTIGYAPRGWTVLRDHLYGHGFTEAELLAAGLVTTARNGSVIDVFRDRVMFPIRNPDGQVVAFTGRDLSGRAEVPKYRNTTTTSVYRKSELLYGLAEQFDTHTQPAAVLLVEGPADVAAVARMRISLPHSDYPDPFYAVAPCGTALTAQQVTLLAAAVPPGTPVVVAFDADTAGASAIDKSYTLLRDWPGPLDAMALPAGADPASLVAAGPAHALARMQEARTPLVDLLAEHRLAPHLDRLHTRLEELARFDRDPSTESLAIRLDALHAVARLLTEVADRDQPHAAALALHVAGRLQLDPLTVFEAMYPPDEPDTADTDSDDPETHAAPADQQATSAPAAAQDERETDPLGGAGFPDPTTVGHQYAVACPTRHTGRNLGTARPEHWTQRLGPRRRRRRHPRRPTSRAARRAGRGAGRGPRRRAQGGRDRPDRAARALRRPAPLRPGRRHDLRADLLRRRPPRTRPRQVHRRLGRGHPRLRGHRPLVRAGDDRPHPARARHPPQPTAPGRRRAAHRVRPPTRNGRRST